MIQEVNGNAFLQNADIVCHQVNCVGVMGAGIAKEAKKRMKPEDFEKYRNYCKANDAGNLGSVFFCRATDPAGLIIANCFSQNGIGRRKVQTNYGAMKMCFESVKEYAKRHDMHTICVPDHIGCGLAGGDWKTVLNTILIPAFDDPDFTLLIAKL